MKVSEAIEQLEGAGKDRWCPWSQDLKDAIKLGIEALKFYQQHKLNSPHLPLLKLPGETPDDR